MKHRPENDPRLPRHLADTVAISANIAEVAIVALVPLRAGDEALEAITLAGKQAPAAAQEDSDTRDR